MIPTEHEYTVATQAAAKKALSLSRPELDWADLHPNDRRALMEPLLPLVDAAISAIPDRLDRVRSGLRLLEDEDITPEGRRILEKLVEA